VASTPLVADNSISAGAEVSVTFGGFVPGEFVQLIVASTPQVIGSGYANAQGVVTLSGNIPASLSSGNHTLAVYAPESGTGFKQPITVAGLTLPATGTSNRLWPMMMMLFGGAALIVAARRRRIS
jgi:LPXTG-motif cell wall-anchored protein